MASPEPGSSTSSVTQMSPRSDDDITDESSSKLTRELTANETRLVLVGRTGEGKTSTANSILGAKVLKVKAALKSVTSECCYVEKNIQGKHIVLVDTPGLFDTDKTIPNDQTLLEISKCLIISSPGPHTFLLVLAAQRFTEEIETSVQLLRKTFGEHFLTGTIVVFTRKDDLDDSDTTIEDFLSDAPDYMKALLEKCGGRYMAINNRLKGEENEKQIKALLSEVENLVELKGGSYYSSDQYEEVESNIKKEEKRRLREIEVKRTKTVVAIQSQHKRSDYQEAEIEKVNRKAEKEKQNVRKDIREESILVKMARAYVGLIGATTDAIEGMVGSIVKTVTEWFKRDRD